MRVYEAHMRVYEGIWGYMRVYEVYEGIWGYMKEYEAHMRVYEGIWGYMTRPEGLVQFS